jgi:hypothetical protein
VAEVRVTGGRTPEEEDREMPAQFSSSPALISRRKALVIPARFRISLQVMNVNNKVIPPRAVLVCLCTWLHPYFTTSPPVRKHCKVKEKLEELKQENAAVKSEATPQVSK